MSDGSVATRVCVLRLDPRGFVRATIQQGAEMELEDARAALCATAQLTCGRKMPVLVDIRRIKFQSKEARNEFVSEDAERVTSAVAVVVGSPVSRMIGNFFLMMNQHRFSTQLFTDETAAIRWLLGHGDS